MWMHPRFQALLRRATVPRLCKQSYGAMPLAYGTCSLLCWQCVVEYACVALPRCTRSWCGWGGSAARRPSRRTCTPTPSGSLSSLSSLNSPNSAVPSWRLAAARWPPPRGTRTGKAAAGAPVPSRSRGRSLRPKCAQTQGRRYNTHPAIVWFGRGADSKGADANAISDHASPRSYPRAFGKALARLAGQHLAPEARPPAAVSDPWETVSRLRAVCPDEDLWADAKMEEVLHYLLTNKHLVGRPPPCAARPAAGSEAAAPRSDAIPEPPRGGLPSSLMPTKAQVSRRPGARPCRRPAIRCGPAGVPAGCHLPAGGRPAP